MQSGFVLSTVPRAALVVVLFIAFAVAHLAVAQSAGITNMDLVPGIGDFEYNWPDNGIGEGWGLWYWTPEHPMTFSLDGSTSATGQKSQKVSFYRAGSGEVAHATLLQTQTVGRWDSVASAGETWTIGYKLKTSSNLSGISTQVWIEYGMDGIVLGSQMYRPRDVQPVVTSWTQYAFNFTVPSGCNWFRYMISFTTGAEPVSGAIWLDSVTMTNGQSFPALVSKPMKTYLMYPYNLGQNWVYATTHYDGGRWEEFDETSLYDTVRPDAINSKFCRISYLLIDNEIIHPADLLSYADVMANHPEWVLRDADGNLITDGRYVAYDVGNPGFQQATLNSYIPMIQNGHFKWVMWDSFDIHAHHNFTGIPPAQYQTDAAWQGAIDSFLRNVANRLRQPDVNTKVLVNLAHCPPTSEPLKTWLQFIDGYMIEYGFVAIDSNGVVFPRTFSSWKTKFMSVATTPADKVVIVKNDGADNTAFRRFGLASFLASKEDNGYLSLCTKGELVAWHNDLEAPLGTPLGKFWVQAGDMSNGGLILRQFQNGLALVNAHDTTTLTYALPVAYTDLDGQSVPASTISLAPNTGMILIGANRADTQSPSVSLTSPTVTSNLIGNVTVAANVTDDTGIHKSELLVDGVSVAYRFDGPHSFTWDSKSVANGAHLLSIRATDAREKVTTSPPVTVTTANELIAPNTAITNVADNTTILGNLTVLATATDNVGVTKVEFYFDDTLMATDTAPPYSLGWESRWWPNGAHKLTTRAYDACSNMGVSPIVNVVVNNLPPTVTITNPTNGATLSGMVDIRTTTYSNSATVRRVEFSIDGVIVNTDTTSPFSYVWNTTAAANGVHAITAKAFDAYNKSGEAVPVAVTVNNSATIGVSISNPVAGATLADLNTINANVTASGVMVSKVEFFTGTTLMGSDTTAPYSLGWETRWWPNGSHSLTAKVTTTTGTTATSSAVPVTVNNALPSVAITSPAQSATVIGVTAINANALSTNSAISKVEFFVDGTLKGTVTNAPYSYAWDTSASGAGAHSLTAKAIDNYNRSVMSSPVQVTVTSGTMNASITSPTPDAVLTGLNPINVNVAASGVTVTKVEFYAGMTLMGSDTSAPYSLNWETRWWFNTTYNLTAKAYASNGSTATSPVVSVTVANPYPTVNITSPANGANVTGVVSVQAIAASANAAISRVEFYAGTTLIASDTTVPFAANWDTASLNGSFSLTARAFDSYGKNTTSSPVTVTVNAVPLSVNLTSPANFATVSGLVAVTTQVTSSQPVTKVEFFVDGALAATDTNAPYSFDWETRALANGLHTVYARVTNSTGATANSPAHSVTVANQLLTVSFGNWLPGAKIVGMAECIAVVTPGNSPVERVELYIDGMLIGTDTMAPYSVTWNATFASAGLHAAVLKAYDAFGTVATASLNVITGR